MNSKKRKVTRTNKNATRNKDNDTHTRERLIQAAQKIFAEKGFKGTTVKDICYLAKANISLVSYHFNGKEGIYKACLEQFGKDRLKESITILTNPESAEDFRVKLRLWCVQFLQCHIDDNNVCEILHRENPYEHDFMREIFESTFLKAFESMVKFFQQTQKKGILSKECDPILASGMLYGSLIHAGSTKHIQKEWLGTSIEDEKFRMKTINEFVKILLHGIS